MKQMDECLDRVFYYLSPLPSKKWKAFRGGWIGEQPGLIFLYHYHHLVLVYNTETYEVEYDWYEKPADKRGLDAAIDYLKKKFPQTKTR